MKLTLKIWRQKDSHAKGKFITYKLDAISPNCSFLEMLDILNEQ
jgi:succinate dehydrogenase / fumarate reductase iron-sulfur subunit